MLLLMVFPLQYSFAAEPSVVPNLVETNFGYKIYLKNLDCEFTVVNSDAIITITFEKEVTFEDLSNIRAAKIVKSVVPQANTLNIFLDQRYYKVEKFKESLSDVGITINDPNKTPDEIRYKNYQSKQIDVDVKTDSQSTVISFSWSINTGMTAYQRNDKIWIVFDQATQFGFSREQAAFFKQHPINPAASILSYDPKAAGIKYSYAYAYKQDNLWVLELSNTPPVVHELALTSRPYAAPAPRVEIEFIDAAVTPLPFVDPEIGDNIVAIPATTGATAIRRDYNFIDFKAPSTIQGAVLFVNSDSINVVPREKIAMIQGSNALNIAPKVFKRDERNFELFKKVGFLSKRGDTKSILALKMYEDGEGKYHDRLLQLRNVLEKEDSKEKRVDIYKNLAVFQLANGMGSEANLMLELLKQENPDFKQDYEYKLIVTAIKFRQHEYLNAYKTARTIDIADVPIAYRKEIRFWQAITSFMVSNSEDFLNRLDPVSTYVNDQNSFLSEYTRDYLYSFGAAIARYKIEKKEYSDAKSILDKLEKMNLTGATRNNYLSILALYYAGLGDSTSAQSAWTQCMDDVADLMNRSVCMYDNAVHLHKLDLLSDVDFIKELEYATLIWRGDDFEVNVLRDLGHAYYGVKDYINALRSWKKIVDYYPYSPEALELTRLMGQTFVDFFTTGMDNDVSDFQAASIFVEFEDLVPIGPIGDQVVLRYADHLMNLDLLDQAQALLNHQVMNRLKGYQRELAINKLASVYMLDKRPELAVEIINLGDFYEELPDDIAEPRKYIHARALHATGKDDSAIEVIQDELTEEADDIRCQIYWDMQNWKKFNDYAEPRIYKIRNSTDPLSTKDTSRLVRLALSYLILGEDDLLRDLLRDFLPRVSEDNNKGKFLRLLASVWEAFSDRSVEGLRNLTNIENKVRELFEYLNKLDAPENSPAK